MKEQLKKELLDIWDDLEFDITITEACKFQVRSGNRYESELHCHRGYELNYINFGLCVMEIEGSFISLCQGDCIIISPGVSHSFMMEFQRGCDITQLEYDMGLPQKIPASFQFLQGKHRFEQIRSCGMIRGTIENLYHSYHEKVQQACRKTFLELGFAQLYWVLASVLQERGEERGSKPGEVQKSMRQNESKKDAGLLQYINQNYDTKINIESLAESFGVSSRYIRKFFAEHVGMSCTDYITMLRMEKAKQMLWRTKKSITEIAFAVGYSSSQYFGNVFRRFAGISPGEFRRKYREGTEQTE